MIHKIDTARDEKNKKISTKENAGIASSPSRPWPLIAVGVVTASGLGLIAASLIGVGEVAIAGTAGYLAYRRISGKSESESEQKVEAAGRKRQRAA